MNNNYKKPLPVIYTGKNSIKLLKGHEYLAIQLYQAYGNKYIYIDNTGGYNIKNFTLLNGSSLEHVDVFKTDKYERVRPNEVNYKGKYVKFSYSSSKFLKIGEIYYVEEQIDKNSNNINKKPYNHYFNYVFKLKNIKNYVPTYNFNELSSLELRNIKLNNIKGNIVKTGDMRYKLYRKILFYIE